MNNVSRACIDSFGGLCAESQLKTRCKAWRLPIVTAASVALPDEGLSYVPWEVHPNNGSLLSIRKMG